MDITYHTIGTIHSPFKDLSGMPIQPSGEASAAGTVEILPELSVGLKDLEGFSHLILLYHLHKVERISLTVTPFLGSETHGLFATRAPHVPQSDRAVGRGTGQDRRQPPLSGESGHPGRNPAAGYQTLCAGV